MTGDVKLFKINILVSPSGVISTQVPFFGEEKKKVYIVSQDDDDLIAHHVGKTAIMKVDSIFNNVSDMVGYHIWCFPEQVDEAFAMILKATKDTVEKIRSNADLMSETLKGITSVNDISTKKSNPKD